mgnify:CR=1 FL=1
MWQKCPICNGTGKVLTQPLKINRPSICPTCNGHNIINELTGLPPNTTRPLPNLSTGDFRDNGETQQEYFGK